MNDIDLVLWHEGAGAFVIEIKAVPLDHFEFFSFDSCQIKGRGVGKSPQRQAMTASMSLLNYLQGRRERPPFFVATACFPLISRKEWNRCWAEHPEFVGAFADGMLFSEDLERGAEYLRERLCTIRKAPPVRKGPESVYRHNPDQLESFKKAISPQARPRLTPNDAERLRQIETKISRDAVKEVGPNSGAKITYTGPPGTGKTFRLLQIAVHHAQSGLDVLFCCFNKVLAADIRRLLQYSETLKVAQGSVDVYDCFYLALDYTECMPNDFGRADEYDEWAAEVVKALNQKRGPLKQYDTVLIDEAQDFKQWAFELCELHAGAQTTRCVAFGRGQELYMHEPAQYLVEFEQNSKKKTLRRNFRNTRPVFELSYLFFECEGDSGKIHSVVNRLRGRKSDAQLPLIDREEGRLPSFREVNDAELDWQHEGTSFFADSQADFMQRRSREIVEEQISELTDREREIDILILVPDTKCMELAWVRSALYGVGVEFTDYTDESRRRAIAPNNQVRICTYHSARGLEGQRVLIFGFERLGQLAKQVGVPMKNIGYVVLSRAVFECVIVRRALSSRRDEMRFLDHAITAISD